MTQLVAMPRLASLPNRKRCIIRCMGVEEATLGRGQPVVSRLQSSLKGLQMVEGWWRDSSTLEGLQASGVRRGAVRKLKTPPGRSRSGILTGPPPAASRSTYIALSPGSPNFTC